MPVVPRYDSFQATPNTLPQVGLTPPNIPDIAGKSAERMGAAQQEMGNHMASIAEDMAMQANQLRVDDAMNQAREAANALKYGTKDRPQDGYLNLKGKDALDRPDGKFLPEEFGDKLNDHINNIADTLGNDAQKLAFAKFSNQFGQQFREDATQHAIREQTTYGLSVAEGAQKNAINDIQQNWNNPKVIDDAVSRIQAESYRQAQLQGKSAEWQEANSRSLTSSAHKTALMQALEENNPAYAEGYMKRYSHQMNGDDLLSVQGLITKRANLQIGMQASADAIQKVSPTLKVGGMEQAFNVALISESGGKQFGTDGNPITSNKGAIGIAQIMPGTGPEAAKLAGLPWDENRLKTDESYNKALGMAYFQKQLQDNGGDVQKAWAAYNAGPGALQKAIKMADSSGLPWLDFLPKETQDYVAANAQKYAAGEGKPRRATFEDVDNILRQDARLQADPERYKNARADAKQRYDEITASLKQKDEDAVATAIQWGSQNGYRFSDMPASIMADIPPGKLDDVRNTLSSLAKGNNVDDPKAYQEVNSDPTTMARMSDAQWYTYSMQHFSADTKQRLDAQRGKLLGKVSGEGGPGDLNSEAIKENLNNMLSMLKINPDPSKTDTSAVGRVGAIRMFVDQYFSAKQREAGKKFNDAEVLQHLNTLFAKNVEFKGLLWGTNSYPLMGLKVSDIPSDVLKELKKSFAANNNPDPTDPQLLNAYMMSQVASK